MYISLGLLWLCFKIIQGKITDCPLGGIRDTDLCLKLKKDTVFHRFYLWGFQTQILGNKDNKYDVYDIAYEQFKEVSKNKAVGSELNVMDPIDVMRPSKAHTETFLKQAETKS
ncbi:uncharacterized protein LOC107883334 [Acyrthosiphon pisum]|uniref:Uncharacterized protein n=1 Tax=Acyrthosiphon pisum TaxID=7029 RepID=A0A8R2D372_ACYPI|nr:uncharacterized protein LOC107883334 [Acyrthosiphon pisum]|eukprot:XP_016658602.1 PREDICTED: uncharacterized protein LOC107883334 [Acyrthosiphon pisum]